MRRLMMAGAAVLMLAACGSDSKTQPTAPVATAAVTAAGPASTVVTTTTTAATTTGSVPATTVATTTTAPPTTVAATTTVAPTTTTPAPTGAGLVWSSVEASRVNTTDGHPVEEADGITSSIDMVVIVPTSSPTDLGDGCREAITTGKATGAAQCLYVQWSFDVSPDFRVDGNSPQGGLTSGDLVTADGHQISSAFIATGYPGTVGNFLNEFYPGGDLGSIVHWSTGSNLVGYTDHAYTLPISDLPPIYF